MDFFFVEQNPEQEADDLRTLLKSPAARRVIRRLLAACKVLGPARAQDAAGTEYNEGVRAAGLWLAGRIEIAAPGELSRLLLDSSMELQAVKNRGGKMQTRTTPPNHKQGGNP